MVAWRTERAWSRTCVIQRRCGKGAGKSSFSGGDGAGESLSRARNLGFLPLGGRQDVAFGSRRDFGAPDSVLYGGQRLVP